MRRKKTLLASIAEGQFWQLVEVLYVTSTQVSLREKETRQQALNMWNKTYSLLLVLRKPKVK